jgi:hypothetical protein
MPTVEATITVGIPDEGASLGEAEKRVAEAVQEAGQGAAGGSGADDNEVEVHGAPTNGQASSRR